MTTSAPEQSETFAQRGYIILRGMLSAAEVEHARSICAEKLTRQGVREMMTSDFLASEFMAGIGLRDRVVAAVGHLVGGPVVLYPNCTARMNVYVPWHVDSTFVGADTEHVWEPGFVHVQAGLYLQDNDPIGGGGIDVISGSHLMSFDGHGRIRAEFDNAARILSGSHLRETVDTKAGDIVLWHARLLHASTPVQQESEREKFGIFFSYGRDDLRDNHRFMSQISVDSVRTMNGVSRTIPRLAEIAGFRYPGDFPDAFVREAEHAGVRVVTL
ncbi:phytanoyl-CoA dioxygenase family protein [Sphaerisporangium perillae]|uniref:phytanoyl-CoA dioxygenase family protein n=1 Tax=Sphaerisporangium perillae TaxID=2935860 RepID=UPI00200E41C2|nr:phytanoyl-CoA dioxygenase family protein [Sphaerisporangium perillae]